MEIQAIKLDIFAEEYNIHESVIKKFGHFDVMGYMENMEIRLSEMDIRNMKSRRFDNGNKTC